MHARHLFRVRTIAFDAREAHVHGWDGCVDLRPFSGSPNATSSSDDVTLRRGLPKAASSQRNVGLAERKLGLGGTHARVRGTRAPHPWTWKPRSSNRRLLTNYALRTFPSEHAIALDTRWSMSNGLRITSHTGLPPTRPPPRLAAAGLTMKRRSSRGGARP